MKNVGIRELKQNASQVVACARDGEEVTITLRGEPVAILTPLPQSPLEQLVTSGKARMPLSDMQDLPEPLKGPSLSAELKRMREAERY